MRGHAIMVTKKTIVFDTIQGPAAIGYNDGAVARLWLPGMAREKLKVEVRSWASGAREALGEDGLSKRITAYFEGAPVDFHDPVDISHMTSFEQKILLKLREKATRGKVVTYSSLAALAGHPGAARAIGRVMAKNPLPLIIPCHRVVRTDGGMGGFSGPGGRDLKRKMLSLENALKVYPK